MIINDRLSTKFVSIERTVWAYIEIMGVAILWPSAARSLRVGTGSTYRISSLALAGHCA